MIRQPVLRNFPLGEHIGTYAEVPNGFIWSLTHKI